MAVAEGAVVQVVGCVYPRGTSGTANCSAGAALFPRGSSSTIEGLAVPGTPLITAVTPGDGSVEVTFSAPEDNGGSEILSYMVMASSGSWAEGATSPITISGVANFVRCYLYVRAYNAQGWGEWSSEVISCIPAADGYWVNIVADDDEDHIMSGRYVWTTDTDVHGNHIYKSDTNEAWTVKTADIGGLRGVIYDGTEAWYSGRSYSGDGPPYATEWIADFVH